MPSDLVEFFFRAVRILVCELATLLTVSSEEVFVCS